MERWISMFAVKALGAGLNPHLCQEPQEDPWKFTCQSAYMKQQPPGGSHARVNIHMYVQYTTAQNKF